MTTTPRLSHFGRALHQVFDEQRAAGRKPDSIRSLARAMGAGDEGRSAVAKRSLHKWISGRVAPSPASRGHVAAALDVAVERFADPDDEEADPLALFAALLERAVDAAVAKRFGAQTPHHEKGLV